MGLSAFWGPWFVGAMVFWFVTALVMLATSEPTLWRDLMQSLAFLVTLPALPMVWLLSRSPKLHHLKAVSLARFADACAADLKCWSFSYRQRGIIIVRRGPGWKR